MMLLKNLGSVHLTSMTFKVCKFHLNGVEKPWVLKTTPIILHSEDSYDDDSRQNLGLSFGPVPLLYLSAATE